MSTIVVYLCRGMMRRRLRATTIVIDGKEAGLIRGRRHLSTDVEPGQHTVRAQNGNAGSHDLTVAITHRHAVIVRIDWNLRASSFGADPNDALVLSETTTYNDRGARIADVPRTFGNPRSRREQFIYRAGMAAVFIGFILQHTVAQPIGLVFTFPGAILVIVFFFRKHLYRDPTKQ